VREEDALNDEIGVATVNRALSILDVFTQENKIVTLAHLSAKTGLYKSTILRLLQSLEVFGYVLRLSSGSYILGPAPIRLAAIAKSDLHPAEKIMPVLRSLVQATGESASFYVRSANMRLCAYRVDSPRSIRDNVQAGQLLPLNVGAGGRVLIEFDNLTDTQLAQADKPFLRVTYGERDAETAAMACPVFGPNNKLEGAVSLSGPISHFSEEAVAAMAPHILDAARSLTTSFQGDPRVFNL
jgi:DNA-binding IclR family transcriptional regulator